MSHTDRLEDPTVRRRLIETAVDLFGKNGFHATGVQDICAAAGVTKGSFYYYFAAKDELLLTIHNDYIDQELQRNLAIAEKRLPPRESLRALMRSLLQGVSLSGPRVTIFEQEWRHLTKDEFANVRRKREELASIITAEVQRGIDEGAFRPVGSAKMIAFALFGMSGWAHRWYRPAGSLEAEEISDLWTDMILDGLSIPDGRRDR